MLMLVWSAHKRTDMKSESCYNAQQVGLDASSQAASLAANTYLVLGKNDSKDNVLHGCHAYCINRP